MKWDVAIYKITASSQLKSANAKTDIANHSGKENREKYAHKNPDIDPTKSKHNVELDFYNDRELLAAHYHDKIEKRNKTNNSAARRWDLDKCLASFEGKEVNLNSKKTKNVRWATASQISYFGGKDSLGDVLKLLEGAGASPEAIREAYSSGYEEYVKGHNEKFTTLPIYHSDIHFDETTPHGHDAIVVMGHTAKGQASDSINNALGELYGYPTDWKGKQANMVRYRTENDAIMFGAIGSKLEALGEAHGLDFKFEFLRTGETGSKTMQDYKMNREYDRIEGLLLGKNEELKEKADELQEVEQEQDIRTKAQKGISQKNKERKRELDAREKDLNGFAGDLLDKDAAVLAREKALKEKEEELKKKEQHINSVELAVRDVVVAAIGYSSTNYDKKMAAKIQNEGLMSVPRKEVLESVDFGIYKAVENKQGGAARTHVTRIIAEHKTAKRPVRQDDGPEL